MVRSVRLLLASTFVALTSVVGLVAAAPAAYADLGGAWSKITQQIEVDNSPDLDCEAYVRVKQTTLGNRALELYSGARCIGGYDVSPWACQPGESECTTLVVTVEGTGCSGGLSSPGIAWPEYDNAAHTGVKFSGTSGFIGDQCVPTQVCLAVSDSGGDWGNDSYSAVSCDNVALDLPEGNGYSCAYGSAHGGYFALDTGIVRHQENVNGWYEGPSTASVIVSGTQGTWITYALYANPSGVNGPTNQTYGAAPFNDLANQGTPGASAGAGNTGVSNPVGPIRYWAGHAPDVLTPNTQIYATQQQPPASLDTQPHRLFIGVGVFRLESWGTAAQLNNTNGNIFTFQQGTNYATSTGVFGVNDASRCAFYFGAKVWNSANTITDEPTAPVTMSAPPPPPEDPEPEEPPTDCDGLACLLDLAGILRSIWSTLKGILSAILNLAEAIGDAINQALSGLGQFILDGIAALFIPDEGFYDDAFLDMKQAWKGSAPGAFLTGFSEMDIDLPGSSCSGIPVNFSVSGVAVDFQLGAACSGAAAAAASTVRTVVSAVVVLFGGLTCVRAIGSGFGWSPSIGRGGEAA